MTESYIGGGGYMEIVISPPKKIMQFLFLTCFFGLRVSSLALVSISVVACQALA